MATLAVVPQPPTLSESDRAAVVSLVSGVLSEEKSARRAEVREAWRQRAFKNGIQHMWYDPQSYAWMLPSASGQELPSFMDVYNIYTPHWRSFVSILSQNPPGVNFTPNDLTQSRDVTAANYAEKMRHRVDRLVHMKDRQAETSSYFCTDGRTIHRTYTNDKNKLNVTVHGVLESKVPIYVRRMDRWSYCVLSEEIDIWEAKEEYQEFAEEIESSDTTSAEASYERLARLGVIASKRGSFGDALKNVVTQHVAWLRPSRYRKAPTATEQVLRQMYPQGFRATVINDVLLEIVPEVMEDALSVQWPLLVRDSHGLLCFRIW
jgi:DNA-binding transcriptional regulator YhcF (GntR family)